MRSVATATRRALRNCAFAAGGLYAGSQISFYTAWAVTGNPQPFTGYWRLKDGALVVLKQWGAKVTGDVEGTVQAGKLVGANGKEAEVVREGEVLKIGDAEAERVYPTVIVLCGPSGVGKGTLLAKLFEEFPEQFGFSISHTTRKPRPGEEDGKDYYFTTHDAIKEMISKGEFVEYAEVHGNYYGTSKKAVADVESTGKLCVLDIDIQGAQKVAQAGIPFVGIFIKPPSREELERRLRGRGTETEERIVKRLNNALGEIAFCDTHTFFTHELVNANLEECYKELVAVIGQTTRAKALPKVSYSVDAAPNCGVRPQNA